VAVVLLALLAVVQAGGATNGGILAISGTGSNARLGYIDPGTLKLVGKSTQVGYYEWPAARSPDGAQLALGRSNPSGIRIMDLRRLRTIRAFKVGDGVGALSWVAPRRLLVLSEGLPVLAVDPVTGRQLWERNLTTFPGAIARSARGFVLLSPPADDYQNAIGPSTLTTVNGSGAIRSVVLDRIVTGAREPDETHPAGAQRFAGLAVDVAGNRAFVVGSGEPIAEIDLTTLAVTYHGGTRTLAKLLDGPSRTATWLSNGKIAVTGYDGLVGKASNGNVTESGTPAGLSIVDTRDWSTRMVDPGTDAVAVADDTLVAYSWLTGAGLRVYGLDGSLRVRALAGPMQNVQVGGGVALASMADGKSWRVDAVDLSTGATLASVPRANILLVP
jgi:hypothetical protein